MAANAARTDPESAQTSQLAAAVHGLTAAVALAGLLLQVVLVSRGVGTQPGLSLGSRLLRLFSFFTVESNVLVAVTSLLLAHDPRRRGAVFRVFRLMGLVGITVTGVVYARVLAGLVHFSGWEKVADTIFHYVVPFMAVLAWLLVGPRPRIDVPTLVRALAFPLLWIAWTLVHGEASGWYPYPFVDVDDHGYAIVAVNCMLVAVLTAAVGAAFLELDKRLWVSPRTGSG